VNTVVNLEMALLLEARGTQIALERPLSAVDANMTLALAFASESLGTCGTWKALQRDFHCRNHRFVTLWSWHQISLFSKVVSCHLQSTFWNDVARYRQLILVNDLQCFGVHYDKAEGKDINPLDYQISKMMKY